MTQSQPAQPEGTLAALRRHTYLLLAAACLPFAALNAPAKQTYSDQCRRVG